MSENIPLNNPDPADRQKVFFEKAKKGILLHLKQNGTLTLSQLHDFSLNKYLIQHQSFSRLMEGMVGEKLLSYDFEKDIATVTEWGAKYAELKEVA